MKPLQDWEEFVENFDPKFNHIAAEHNPSRDPESCAPVNGRMFETYGDELSFVANQDHRNVWTVVHTDESDMWYICKGYHHVNRLGYIVTAKPWDDSTQDAEY